MSKLDAVKTVSKTIAKRVGLRNISRAKRYAGTLTTGIVGGVVANAIGGQYPTKPRKARIKKALRGM